MSNNTYLYLGIALFVLVLIAVIIIVLNIKTKKGRILKQINNLEDEKMDILKIQTEAKLVKISIISQSNVVFQSIFQENKKIYDNILELYNSSLDLQIKQTRELCMSGDYKHVNENIKDISIRLKSFKDEMIDLDHKLNEVLKDEDNLNAQIEPLKSKFNNCNIMYDEYKENINFNHERYDSLFSNIKEKFSILNDYMLKGDYVNAKDVVSSLYEEINFLYNNLKESPRIVDVIINKIPQELNNVINKYNEMQQNQFPLYNVSASSTINNIKEELLALITKIRNFDYDSLDEKCYKIKEKINKLSSDLEKEVNAKEVYEEKNKTVYDFASDLEGIYLSNLRKHTTWEQVYNSNDELDLKMKTIKDEVNNLNIIRRKLDSLNYGMQPYSIRLEKLNELEQQNSKVQSLIDSYNNYIYGMRDTCENSNSLVKDSATKLKQLELKLRSTNIQGLINNYSDAFINGYQLINKLEELFKVAPIDVKKTEIYSLRLEELVNELTTSLEKDLLLLKEAENLLMFSAQFKNDYADFEKAHIKAKGYFYNCRFETAIELLKDALDNIQISIPFELKGGK